MTFEEARNLLAQMRAAKRRANMLKARIADLESDAESIRSALGGEGFPTGSSIRSRVEELAIRIETEREKHMAALEKYFAIEDKLSSAIDTLTDDEKEIILMFYLDGRRNWQIGNCVGYEIRNVQYIKKRAIEKIAQKL